MKENYLWVHSCIVSCKNEAQLLGAKRLIELFEEIHSNEKDLLSYQRFLWREWRTQKTAVNHRHESEFAG